MDGIKQESLINRVFERICSLCEKTKQLERKATAANRLETEIKWSYKIRQS